MHNSESVKIAPEKEIWLLTATILASSMAMIDSTALNVALPALQRSLGLNGSGLLWVVNSYLLFLSALLLAGGSLGDFLGRKKIFTIGIIIFTLSSFFCGIAINGFMLIVARGFQGVGGALMVPGSLTLIAALFPPEKKGVAIGTWSMFSALTTIIGPVLGGILAGVGLWRWVFFINLPLGAFAIWILMSKIPESKVQNQNASIDYLGALLITLALGFLTYGFIQASEWGFKHPVIYTSLFLSLILFIAFIRREKKAKSPLIPLFLFNNSTFSGLNAMTFVVYGALGSVLFFLPLNIIQVQGYSEIIAGLGILPFGLLIAFLARISGKWVDRFGFKKLLIIGPVITSIGFISFSFIGYIGNGTAFLYTFLPALICCGIGMGLTVVPLTTGVMVCINEDYSGVASGINNTLARAAGVIALSLLGSIALLQFNKDFKNEYDMEQLSEIEQNLMEEELLKFAEAKAPDSFDLKVQENINKVLINSFLNIFNSISIIGGLLPLLGAGIVLIYVKE